ncbi:hypothetical protein D3C72_1536990 [compost metagenome]
MAAHFLFIRVKRKKKRSESLRNLNIYGVKRKRSSEIIIKKLKDSRKEFVKAISAEPAAVCQEF